jgi:hypothetical protein
MNTLIAVVLDRSGSMGSIRNDVVGGFDHFLAEQKKVPGDCKVTLTQFDTDYEIVWNLLDIKDLVTIGTFYSPRGSTALFDAVGRTINAIGEELAKKPEHERPSKVIFCIVTDGHENASKEFNKKQIADMIKHQQEKYRWDFTFIGANVDAFAEGAQIGIRAAGAMQYEPTSKGIQGAFRAMSNSSARSRRTGEAISYTSSERKMAMGEKDDDEKGN